eukprot:2440598-Pyramimonas_sp.AAC.1
MALFVPTLHFVGSLCPSRPPFLRKVPARSCNGGRVRPRVGASSGLRCSASTTHVSVDFEPYRSKPHNPKPAREARDSFLANVERGEATLELALNALHIAAEDDSL